MKRFNSGITHKVSDYVAEELIKIYKSAEGDPKKLEPIDVYINGDTLKGVIVIRRRESFKSDINGLLGNNYKKVYDSSGVYGLMGQMPDMQYKTRLEHSLYITLKREEYRISKASG